MSLIVTDELKEAILKVRDDNSPENFVVGSYDDDQTITVAACGDGGVNAMKDAFLENDICYALIRVNFEWESAGQVHTDTVKFVFIIWRPDSIPLKRKTKIGRYDGAVKKTFQSYHTTMDINTLDEVSDEILQKLIEEITMKANRVTEKKGTSMFLGGKRLSWKKGKTETKPIVPGSDYKAVKGANVNFEDEEAIKEAIADVRDDSSPTQWCLTAYKDKKTIVFVDKGDGDVSEMLSNCKDNVPGYGFFRVTEQFDKSVTVKFCFVSWSPPNVKPMMKAAISTHRGTVNPLFRPFHQDFVISEEDELNEEIVMDKIGGLTGTKSHVTSRKSVKPEKEYERKFIGGVTSSAQAIPFENQGEVQVAIADVRSDNSDTNWVICGFEGDKKSVQFVLKAKGSNGFEEMMDSFEDSKIQFGLLRRVERVDMSDVARFYYFQWIGDSVSIQTKGYCGVYTGAVNALFSPFFDDISGSNTEDMVSNAKRKIKDL